MQLFCFARIHVQHPFWYTHHGTQLFQKLRSEEMRATKISIMKDQIKKNVFTNRTYTTNLGGFCKLTYLKTLWSGSILAQAKRSEEWSGPKITIERPIAPTGPSSGKLESVSTTRSTPRSTMTERERGSYVRKSYFKCQVRIICTAVLGTYFKIILMVPSRAPTSPT